MKVFQLAKEKGYDSFLYWRGNATPVLSSQCVLIELTLIQKWLREKHKIDVFISGMNDEGKYLYFWLLNIPVADDSGDPVETYETALLDGIEVALKTIKPSLSFPPLKYLPSSNTKEFFDDLANGEIFQYGLAHIFNDLIIDIQKAAALEGVLIDYCSPGTEEYKRYGDKVCKVIRRMTAKEHHAYRIIVEKFPRTTFERAMEMVEVISMIA